MLAYVCFVCLLIIYLFAGLFYYFILFYWSSFTYLLKYFGIGGEVGYRRVFTNMLRVCLFRSGDHDYIGSCTTTLRDICPERLVWLCGCGCAGMVYMLVVTENDRSIVSAWKLN